MAAEAELGSQSEVYSKKTPIIIWRALTNLLSCLFQIFLCMLKVTSTITQLLSSRHPLLAASSFESLPGVELTEHVSSSITSTKDGDVDDHSCIERLKIVLDLDETLVCAYETSSLPAVLREQATEAGLKWFDLECSSSEKEYDGKPKVNHVTVFERPGLHEFLKQIGEFADLVLFTAGLEGYAGPLVDRIDVGNQFRLRLYRPSTICTEYRDHVKDLSCISKDLQRIVIVDNNPFSFLLQPLNGIPCIPFSAGQPHDEQLLKVILPLLKHLSLQKDVRPLLYDRFHMPEWFQKHGIPANRNHDAPESTIVTRHLNPPLLQGT